MSQYPEHDKLTQRFDIYDLSDLIEFLNAKGLMQDSTKTADQLVFEYLEIDEDRIENERKQMNDEL